MFLRRLIEYADRLPKTPANYLEKQVKWFADIDSDGTWIGFVPIRKELLVPHRKRSSGSLAPILLCDKPDYALGIGQKGKVSEKHQAFVKLLEECYQATGVDLVHAVIKALSGGNVPPVPSDLKADDWVLFRVDGIIPSDLNEVKTFWDKYRTSDDHEGEYMCIGCGRTCVPEKRHKYTIKLKGGNGAGVTLVSANDKAYESYSLKNSEIAPMCPTCVEKYSKALNDLISREDTHLTIGDVTYLFWTKQERQFSLRTLLDDPQSDEVKEFLRTPISGKRLVDPESDAFYLAAISPRESRIVLRYYFETTLGRVQEHIRRWILGQYFEGNERHYNIFSLSASFAPSKSKTPMKNISPNIPVWLLQHALTGRPLPNALLRQALLRIAAEPRESKFTGPRMAFIKMFLLQKSEYKGEDFMALDPARTDPAYVCGRLLAQLENIQRLAIGADTTLVDRYYGSASTAPASVFNYLMRNAQNHLAKLRRDKPGLYNNLSRELADTCALLQEFPRHLAAQEQALFAIGFYHQQKRINERIQQTVENKKGEQVQ
ncbi:type I-C CRISPR-associated protein Cas8c/Csd1 [Alicyclobacillus mali (ex Roth et al. 2021)]|uniref:type I-C CRISPR-associated protein Cas8c/Csd1 n=1 Tax=Alicyclobacillus mali (ex Roth et al. 2021) TaxID=1123961 RepID=UPI001A8D2AAA|nr:type I-C CRISPR-associated protein Cas8c/Csd1 [Alicyclobacillus mali (ex Roth et al. 2021)]